MGVKNRSVFKIFTSMKKMLLGVLIVLTVSNVVKFELYILLNPSFLIEKISGNTLLSAIDYRLTVCKSKGLNPLKEINKILYSINFCPVCDNVPGSNNDYQTITCFLPLEPNPDSGQMNIHLRI